ncbi:MAG: O-acetyl-ADP-ribose deacetylase [Oscillospiraceae bacterium]|nr:O-acetyl-ADP-ribose deacetylase [Oscillospiraceae bacterium]
MPLQIVRNDITKMEVDAIVNAANNSLLGGGGVDGAIHRAAGPELLAECRLLEGCETGQAKITKGYQLPAKYVIHTVGPLWNGGTKGEAELLASCYENSLRLAVVNGCESIAFPLISSGIYGYPKEEALEIAVSTIRSFLLFEDTDIMVYLVLLHRAEFLRDSERFAELRRYIEDMDRMTNISTVNIMSEAARASQKLEPKRRMFGIGSLISAKALKADESAAMPLMDAEMEEAAAPQSLESILKQMDETFSQMLKRKIDESGMTDPECYRKANIDRRLFSKIRSDDHYRPKKVTAVAFALALELSLDEAREMLMKAGYALSHSSVFDLIVEYCIIHEKYNVYEVNEMLFAYDQVLIGG